MHGPAVFCSNSSEFPRLAVADLGDHWDSGDWNLLGQALQSLPQLVKERKPNHAAGEREEGGAEARQGMRTVGAGMVMQKQCNTGFKAVALATHFARSLLNNT